MVYLENNGTSYQFISGLRAKRTIMGENSSVRRRRGGLISQGARPNKNWFRSTHPTEKVWQLILIDQYLLFKIRNYVVPNCGTASELNGALYHDMALSMETRLKQKLTSNFIFFHWSAPNPSGKMMIVYLLTIWVFTWYDSMSRGCHMTIFSSKSSFRCRS